MKGEEDCILEHAEGGVVGAKQKQGKESGGSYREKRVHGRWFWWRRWRWGERYNLVERRWEEGCNNTLREGGGGVLEGSAGGIGRGRSEGVDGGESGSGGAGRDETGVSILA